MCFFLKTKAKQENRVTEKHVFFWEGWLSQWYPCKFMYENETYVCNEQFMMAQKAKLFKDNDTLKKIMQTESPREQKALGRKVKNFNQNLWDKHRYDIVYKGNFAKFSQNKELQVRIS